VASRLVFRKSKAPTLRESIALLVDYLSASGIIANSRYRPCFVARHLLWAAANAKLACIRIVSARLQ
jgi:hypothetical protein